MGDGAMASADTGGPFDGWGRGVSGGVVGLRSELRSFFAGAEAAAGFGSTFGAFERAVISGSVGGGGGIPATDDAVVARLDRRWRDATGRVRSAYDRSRNVIAVGREVRTALARLQAAAGAAPVVVLGLLYGDRPPAPLGMAECPECGAEVPAHRAACEIAPLLPIVHLTPRAEELREELAFRLGDERASGVRLRVPAAPAAAELEFWRLAPQLAEALERKEALRAAIDRDEEIPEGSMREAMREVARARKLLRPFLEEAGAAPPDESAALPAVWSVLAGADREVTPRDALRLQLDSRAALERFRAETRDPAELAEQLAAFRAEALSTISTLATESRRLRDESEVAYARARWVSC